MIEALSPVAADRQALLRQRVGLLCQFIRWVALAWIAWALVSVVVVWHDPAEVARIYGRMLKSDIAPLPLVQYVAGLGVILADLAVSAYVAVLVWRLFGHYLAGDIFSFAAVDAMRRLGWVGVAAVVVDLLARPAVTAIITSHLASGARHVGVWAQPNDLLHLLMALFIVALAHVFRTGVEIADDHRLIV